MQSIDHIGLAVSDYARSRDFYDRCLAPLGMRLLVEIDDWAGYGSGERAGFWFGADESPQRPMHIAFSASTRAQVDAFYRAGLDAGATDNGAPGLRPEYHAHYYGAFLLDPDGHNIEAVCHQPE